MGQDSLQLRLKKEFEAFKSILLESTDTLSLRDVRKMLANRLHAPQEEVDAEKKFVKQLVDVALSEQGNSAEKASSLAQPSTLTGVLPEIWTTTLHKLDLSSAIACMQVCKALHEGIASNHFYWDRHTNELMSARYALPLGTFSKTSFTRFHMLVHDLVLCRDCGAFADWPAGQKICRRCWQGYEAAREGQRFMTKDHAKFVFKLRDSDLQKLKHLRAQNPIHPQFQPMQLYERVAVRRVAIERWGSIEAMLRKMTALKELPSVDTEGLPGWAAPGQVP